MTETEKRTEPTVLKDEDIAEVQGVGRGAATIPAGDAFGANTVAMQQGVSVPGSDQMLGETEDEIQLRPAPDMFGARGKVGPKDPGVK